MAGFLGSGDTWFNRSVQGVPQGWLSFGNTTKFEIKETATKKERKSRMRDSYGAMLNSVYVKNPAELAINCDDFDTDNFAVALLGTAAKGSVQGTGTVTDEVVVAKKGASVKVAKQNITTVVVTDQTGVTTYVENTDYTLNTRLGMIEILSGGTIVDGANIKVDYTYKQVTSDKITGSVQPTVKMALMLDGRNFADDSLVIVNIWDATVTPNSPVDFLSENFADLQLVGSMNKPGDKASPYEVDTQIVYA